MSDIKCPKCGSTQLTANKQGFSGKKAVAGAVLTGGIGLLAGTIGSNKVKITCLACGNTFNPGDGVTQASEAITADKSEFDNAVIEEIKMNGMLAAIKKVKSETGVDLGEAKAYVDKVAAENKVVPGTAKSGCAGVVLFIVLGAMVYFLI